MPRLSSPSELEELRLKIIAKRDPNKLCITLCSGTGCRASGSEQVNASLEEEIKRQGVEGKIDIRRTGCHGFCERGPIIVIYPQEICYVNLQASDVPEIVSATKENQIVERVLYVDPVTGEKIVRESDIPFYKHQTRVLLANNEHIDPASIEDYIALAGYTALCKVLFEMTPEQVIDEVQRAGLRGRGGAGFPAGRKWAIARQARGEPKYVIANCDEGDPGAYMDRSLTEGNPHSVLEGLIIGAYAIGARHGYIYCRREYPLALQWLRVALQDLGEYGLLGENILGSEFSFDITINEGAGAFVCGEETALMASIEGKRGMPWSRPPYPATSGVWGKPTNINNVKSWASVPFIINRGADWYSSIGTEGSKGTMIFSLVGKVNNTGLVEVPMGITLRDLVHKIGGGIRGGKRFKAVQTGGPSGGCIPASALDLTVDYESLTAAGSIMGSGGMIVMDEDTCMVDIAKYFLSFAQEESCGKCVPCRGGTRQMLDILERISRGEGEEGDIDKLQRLAETVRDGSLCALGGTAPNPVLTSIRYFRNEYEAHIKEKRCPALVCKELIAYYIQPDKCEGCLICLRNCPVEAIKGGKRMVHVIDQEKCIKCGTCLDVCPPRFSAVAKVSGEHPAVPEEPIPIEK